MTTTKKNTTKKNIDITKSGPMTFRDLQKANKEPYTNLSSEFQSFSDSVGAATAPTSLYDARTQGEQLVSSPLSNTATIWGESRWDDKIATEEQFQNLGDVRAENQGWLSKLANDIVKTISLAGTTFLNGTVGLAFGAAKAAKEGDASFIWDNDFNEVMQAINEGMENVLPNYYTKAEQEQSWYENIFTANFLGDKFLKNLGFTIGAFWSGSAISGALKATRLPKLIGMIAKSAKAPRMVSSTIGSTISAINEGSIEAINNSKDWFETNKAQLDNQYRVNLEKIKQDYEDNVADNGYSDSAYKEYQEALDREQAAYNQSLGKLSEDRVKMGNTDLLMNIPILTMSNLFQFAKLYAGGFDTAKRNLNVIGKIGKYTSGRTNLGAIAGITKGALSEGTEEISQSMASNITGNYYTTDVNNFYKSKRDPNAEQETLSWAKSFSKGINETINDGSAWEEFFIGSLTGALGMPRFRGIRNTEGKFQFPITIEGGAYNEWKEYREAQAKENEIANKLNNRVNSKDFLNYYQGIIRHNKYQNDMNQAVESDDKFDFKNAEHAQMISDIIMFDEAGKLGDLENLIEDSIDTSDENLESIVENTTHTISAKEQQAKINLKLENVQAELTEAQEWLNSHKDPNYRETVNEQFGETMSKEDIDNLVLDHEEQTQYYTERVQQLQEEIESLQKQAEEASKAKDVTIGPFVDENGNSQISTSEGKEEMKKKLTSTRDKILNTIKEYKKIKNIINTITGGRLSNDQLSELVWMKSQLNNWENRITQIASEIKPNLQDIIDVLKNKLDFNKTIMKSEEDKETEEGGFTKEYKQADKNVQNLIRAINDLERLSNSDDKKLGKILLRSPKYIEQFIEQINNFEESELSSDNKKIILDKLNDIKKIQDATEIYANKFKEYLENPQQQVKDHEKVDNDDFTEAQKAEKAKRIDALNKVVNFQEVENLINEEGISKKELEQSISNAAKDYRKASLFKQKALELIENSDSEHKEFLLDMINRRFGENDNFSDLSNESLITELSPEASFLDSVTQDTIQHEFNIIVKEARDKVNSGNSQKQDVKTEKTGINSPENVGKDNVAQPPLIPSTNLLDEFISKISELETKHSFGKEAIDDIIRTLNSLKKSIQENGEKNYVDIRKIQRLLDTLSMWIDISPLSDLINEFNEWAKPEGIKITESPNEILKESEEDNKESPVSKVLKAVVPQFDLETKRNGILIDFVGDDRNQGYSYVYNKLKEVDSKTGKNAFDYVNEGNVKEGDELEVRYEKATDEHPELLALYHNGVLVNYMNTDEDIDGVKEIKEKAKKKENPTVRVSKIMNGMYSYNREQPQSIGELLGTENAVIGVMKNRTMYANTDVVVEPVFDEANSDGKVYILLPNSKGTLSPKRVYVKHLNRTEYDLDTKDNPIANNLKRLFGDLAKLPTREGNLDFIVDVTYAALTSELYLPDSFHLNVVEKGNEIYLQIAFNNREGERQNRNILLKRAKKESLLHIGKDSNQDVEPYTASEEEVYNQVLDAFYEANLSFNVDAKRLSGEHGKDYAYQLKNSDILSTYLTSTKMQGTWFLLNEKPNTTHTNDSFERAKASQQAKGGTRVQFENKEYFVRNGVIFNQTGAIVDLGKNTQQVKDLAYINAAYGNNYFGINQHDGKVLINDIMGKRAYDRRTNKYLSAKEVKELENILEGRKAQASLTNTAVKSLQASQKQVKRDENGSPDTFNGFYMIMEEDGQYHKYQRVHSVIGSNYIGPTTGNAATNRGSLVDEVARQFFIDPVNISKPDEMSEQAFNSLLKGLAKFKKDANKRGLKIITDRTVVFHKYEDGSRIAGELDVFAYNPSTGEITIFDFKTSKYSTKDTSFSKVTNPKLFIRSTKAQYTLQLSAYARLFEDSFGVPVSNLVIIPFQLKYSRTKNNGIDRIYAEPYVPLNYSKNVFENSEKASPEEKSSVKQTSQFRTIKGQFVTMSNGKPEYHQTDMQVLFTTSNNQTFYLAKVGDNYKLILPNGRSMTIDSDLISDEAGRTRNNIMDLIQADNVSAIIQEALSTSPLTESPYGNSVEVNEKSKPIETPTVDERLERGRKAADRLNSMKPTTPSKSASNQEAINNREKDKKTSVKIDLSTPIGRTQLANKKWGELTQEEKELMLSMFEGMEEKDIQEYWDGTDSLQRESFIPACK